MSLPHWGITYLKYVSDSEGETMADQFVTSFDGTKLFYNPEPVDDAIGAVVLVHGLCEHQGRYDYVAKAFQDAGFSTYRFDHRGHGKSEGESAHLLDFNELLDDTNVIVDRALADNPGKPVFLLGHSMGGFTVSLYGAKYPDKGLRGIITSGALVADKGGIFAEMPTGLDIHLQLPNELGDGVCSVDEVRIWYGKDPLNRKSYTVGLVYALKTGIQWFSKAVKRFSYPVFITHGENDGLVNNRDSLFLFQHIASTDKQIKIYGGLFHEILNEYVRDEVIGDMIRWMKLRV